MSDTPRRRLLDRIGAAPSLLAAGTQVAGDIETGGALMVNGAVRGNGRIGGELSMSAEAHWEGDLVAQRAVIAGRITGSITVRDRIEIAATAVIHGRVSARMIAIARGATVDGDVTVTGSEPLVEFDERRSSDQRSGSDGAP
ncbi:MAG TPA: polymer-forming cytoskeletal protein [Steroidobacteraceae bacterium]|jgi:cytoskeletal protein CcmA (bactofilin family)|nr:polymer-forming cytoskeletal protein [Steroidobacteraceae bacterium]